MTAKKQGGKSEPARGLILLDRDGVLNQMVPDPLDGTPDSPLHPEQVVLLPGVPEALARLTTAGFGLCICSNQPSAAKGKITRENLEKVHQKVLALAQRRGGRILSSHICFHRAEDGCSCRKPKPGLLEEAFAQHPGYSREESWMAGDKVTDIQAGTAARVRTVLLAKRTTGLVEDLRKNQVTPTAWADQLEQFTEHLLSSVH